MGRDSSLGVSIAIETPRPTAFYDVGDGPEQADTRALPKPDIFCAINGRATNACGNQKSLLWWRCRQSLDFGTDETEELRGVSAAAPLFDSDVLFNNRMETEQKARAPRFLT